MNQNTLQAVRGWFRDYVASYALENGKLHPMHELKAQHSRRVAGDCRDIARELGWPPEDVAVSEAIGLLHDIARFPQYQQYATFYDSKSFNHGETGYRILSREGVLERCSERDRECILDSVRYHNRRDFFELADAECRKFLKLIRDADKVDILFVINDAILTNKADVFPEILLDVGKDGPVTKEVKEAIQNRRQVSYKHVNSLADIYLVRTAWVYGIHYLPSLRRIAERNLLGELKECIAEKKDVAELVETANFYVSERLSRDKQGKTDNRCI